MTTYIDSSALVLVYVPARFCKAARKAVKASGLDVVDIKPRLRRGKKR